jgi:hypothetical protein
VVALDISKPLAAYAVTHSGQSLHVEAFPKMSLHQLDLTGFNQRLRAHASAFQREASSLAAAAQGRRIWLVYSRIYDTSATVPNGYEVLRRLLMSELRHHAPREDDLGVALRRNNVVLLEPRHVSTGPRRP